MVIVAVYYHSFIICLLLLVLSLSYSFLLISPLLDHIIYTYIHTHIAQLFKSKVLAVFLLVHIMPAVPDDHDSNSPLSHNDMVSLIIVGVLSTFIILSALVWCICCGTCIGRELWMQFARRARERVYNDSEHDDIDGDDANEGLLRQEQRIRYADPFDEFILEETELGILTRGAL
ncbi:hypothetical protein BDF22DRAFT_271719 [Syncephalis plumigaleata]|nr:hypothetical protein BDF22DRAFT_271719 [Syncephalis plumigaleata]